MTVKKQGPTWATGDGREFDSEEEAQRHQEFIDAKGEHDDARRRYGKLLAERQTTADGQPFRFTVLRDYYAIISHWHTAPRLQSVGFYLHNCTVDDRDDCVVVIDRDPSSGRTAEYRIDRLYATERAAKAALLAATEEYLAEVQKQIAELRAAGGPGGVGEGG